MFWYIFDVDKSALDECVRYSLVRQHRDTECVSG